MSSENPKTKTVDALIEVLGSYKVRDPKKLAHQIAHYQLLLDLGLTKKEGYNLGRISLFKPRKSNKSQQGNQIHPNSRRFRRMSDHKLITMPKLKKALDSRPVRNPK